jgi:hypothetical protein
MAEMVRVNARVSVDVNKWLDEYSQSSGVSKSTIVYMALDQYRTTKVATDNFGDMAKLFTQIDTAMNAYEKELQELKKELNEIKKEK